MKEAPQKPRLGFLASMRGKMLLLFLSLSIVPLAGAVGLTWWQGQVELEQRITDGLERSSKGRAKRINRMLQSYNKDAELIAAMEEVRSMNPERVGREIHTFGSQWDRYPSIEVIAADGTTLARNDHGPETDGVQNAQDTDSATDPPAEPRAEGSPVVLLSHVGQTPELRIIAPIKGENGLDIGAVALHMSMNEFNNILTEMRAGQTGEAYIIGREGFLITPSRFEQELKRDGVIKERSEMELRPDTLAAREVLAGRSGLGTYRNYRGRMVTGTYAPIPLKGWGLIVEQEIDEVFAPVFRLRNLMLLMALGFAVLSALTAVIAARRVTGRITGLTQAAEALEQGRLDRRAPVLDKDEVGRLAESFNAMADRIQALVGDLEEQIDAVKESELRYRGLYDGVPLGLYRISPTGAFMEVNLAMSEMIGYTDREAMTETNAMQFYASPGDYAHWKGMVDREGTLRGFEVQLRRGDGTLFWVNNAARAVEDEHGRITCYEASVEDITERKTAEEELERYRQHLEELVEKRTMELQESYARLEEANTRIMESIEYAGTIQSAILPGREEIMHYVGDSFMIWKPKDVIGGDLFWFDAGKDEFLLAVIDCTGHGVSGAVMTMIAATTLDRVVHERGHSDPARILRRLNVYVQRILHQQSSRARSDDGMDIGLCHVSLSRKLLTYAGSRISLFHTNNGAVSEIKGDSQSIGYKSSDTSFAYTNHSIPLDSESRFYMSTDGFIDQIGGTHKLPLGKKRLRAILAACHNEPFPVQKEVLEKAFEEHRGGEVQRDDIMLIGFHIGG